MLLTPENQLFQNFIPIGDNDWVNANHVVSIESNNGKLTLSLSNGERPDVQSEAAAAVLFEGLPGVLTVKSDHEPENETI